MSRIAVNDVLRAEGYTVTLCDGGEQAIQLVGSSQFDLMILDLKMPGLDGLAVLKMIYEKHPDIKAIMLTAHGSMDSAIEALRYKACDFLLKPCQPSEILDTVKRVLHEPQRETTNNQASRIYTGRIEFNFPCGDKIDWKRRFARGKNGQTMPLTPTEIQILEILFGNQNQTVSHQRLVFEAQGYEMDDEEAAKILRPVMSRLRHKLEFIFDNVDWLKTIRGYGYRVEIT
jgi:DNA-binding response OmpR family regulator